jgi:hypothetical protein
MQDHLKYLVVDDIQEWADHLKVAVEEYFVDEKRFAKARVRGRTAYNAAQADDQIADGGWDLVLLDMNLDEGSKRAGARSRISGLDLLGDIARGNRAYFVIIVTGAVTDEKLDRVYDPETAALLRFGAMNEAVKMMPASRVRILHKPEGKSVAAAVEQLSPQLHSALDQYCSVSLERNLFRALPGDPKLLEVCFNGGPRLTLPFEAPFRTIQSALAQPGRMLRVTELIQRVAHSSGQAGAVVLTEPSEHAPRTAGKTRRQGESTEYRGVQDHDDSEEHTVDWSEKDGFGLLSLGSPVDLKDGAIPIETLIGGLLDTIKLRESISGYIGELVNMGVDEIALLSIPKIAAEWACKGDQAREVFGGHNVSERLMEAVKAIKPHLAPIKEKWLGMENAKKPGGKVKKGIRVALRQDTDEMVLARQHWSRFKAKIKARPALKAFYDHMTDWIDRSPTARGHLYYRPPGGGEFYPFWNTQ